MTAIVVGYLTRADLAPSVAEHHRPSRRTVEGAMRRSPGRGLVLLGLFSAIEIPHRYSGCRLTRLGPPGLRPSASVDITSPYEAEVMT